MSGALATYSFLPWLRQGLANRITAADLDPAVKLRATVKVELELSGEGLDGAPVTEAVARDVALYGPGDIVGIDRRAIIRAEPRNWITNFEPNYLAQIEFYDEEFVWRYTPAAPDAAKHRLRPWIMLVVLKEDEFSDGSNILGRPLPYIEVKSAAAFPPANQLWAWAHVHVNRDLAATATEFTSTDMPAVLSKFQSVLNQNPDLAYSRIVCPRKLAENTAYHAFLVPVFETGRLAGLGGDPAKSPNATFSAWADYPDRKESQAHPYYFRWYFRTGKTGDFESLVRLLKPQPVDKRVGTRDMDVQAPGSNLPGITHPALKGVLKLGGALRVPREDFTPPELVEVEKQENWAKHYPGSFQDALANLINLADDYAAQSAKDANSGSGLGADVETDVDPLITPPLYGTWHALTRRLLHERTGAAISPDDNWVHELNLDPRFRVPAGFGTRLVQKEQEKYMDAAWEQLGKVLEANRRIRLAQIAKEMLWIWHDRHIVPLHLANAERSLLLTAPVYKRVVTAGFTVHHHFVESPVQPAMTSAVLRRVLRPRGRLLQAQDFKGNVRPGNLIARVNAGEVSAAPPKQTPAGVVTINQIADKLLPQGAPPFVIDLLRRYPWLRYLLLIVALVILLLVVLLGLGGIALALAIAVAVAALALFLLLSSWQSGVSKADAIREENQSPAAVGQMPHSPDFVLSDIGAGFTPHYGTTDSPEAARFKAALVDSRTLVEASAAAGTVAPKKPLDLTAIGTGILQGINPEQVVPKQLWSDIYVPARIRAELGEEFVEAMAYPEFDIPMYKPLCDISAELFLPNINLIAQNSITLLETNQKFIEAYMVGLNHEFARELLWREFPTDQRGSYFRQFWDVSSFFNVQNMTDEALRERLRDIPPLHKWSKFSALGDHDNRELAGDKEEEVVLVIRGELLKRYPTAVIYAQHAKWTLTDDGKVDHNKERQLDELLPAEEDKPPRSKVRTPLYQAKVAPDIYFFGFDLSVKTAKGEPGDDPAQDPGWFFVIKERPGEPRFGLDIDKQPKLNVWGDLSWADVQPGAPGAFVEITAATPTLTLVKPAGGDVQEKLEQYEDDKNISWNANMSAADLAYVLFQAPVLVAVHAQEMLKR